MAPDTRHPTPAPDVLDVLASLVDKSLVVAESDASGVARYRILETLRAYALEKLEARGEAAGARRRHADYYLDLAVRTDTRNDFLGSLVNWRDFREGLVRVRLVPEYDNCRAALHTYNASVDWEGCLHLIGALSHDWLSYGYCFDPAPLIALVLRHKESVCPSARGLALRGAGLMALRIGDHATALATFHESRVLYESMGDVFGAAISRGDEALVYLSRNDLARASTALDDALERGRAIADAGLILMCLQIQGQIARQTGDLERAEQLLMEVIEVLPAGGTAAGIRGETVFRLAEVAEDRGQIARARETYRRGIALLWQGGYRRTVPAALEACARVNGRADRAATLAGAAAAMRDRLASPLPPAEKPRQDPALAAARERLGTESFARRWAEGQAMTLPLAVAYALAE